MECPDPEVVKNYMKRFAKTINKVLVAYATLVQNDFPKFVSNAKLVNQLDIMYLTDGIYILCVHIPDCWNNFDI